MKRAWGRSATYLFSSRVRGIKTREKGRLRTVLLKPMRRWSCLSEKRGVIRPRAKFWPYLEFTFLVAMQLHRFQRFSWVSHPYWHWLLFSQTSDWLVMIWLWLVRLLRSWFNNFRAFMSFPRFAFCHADFWLAGYSMIYLWLVIG